MFDPLGIVSTLGGFFISLAGRAALIVTGTILHSININLGWLMGIAIDIFQRTITQSFNNDLFNATFIDNTWRTIKDFSNLIIIFFLLIIALATIIDVGIAGLSSFNAKKTLPKLIFVALAVNFSILIARFLLDIFQEPMFFLAKSSVVIGGKQVGVGEGIKFLSEVSRMGGGQDTVLQAISSIGDDQAAMAFAARELTRFLMLLIISVIFIIISVMFIIRVIALWFLLIIAPIAWVVGILPFKGLSNFTKSWWDHFIGWAVYGFVILFFLYVTAIILAAIGSESQLQGSFSLNFNTPGIDDILKNMLFVGKYMVAVVGMFMAFSFAKKSQGVTAGVTAAVGGFVVGNTIGRMQGWTKGKGFVGSRAKEGINRVLGRAQERIGGNLAGSKNRILRGAGRQMQVYGRQRQDDAIKRYKNILSQLNDKEILQELKNPAFGITNNAREDARKEALKTVIDRNVLRRVSPNEVGLTDEEIMGAHADLTDRGKLDDANKWQAQNSKVFFAKEQENLRRGSIAQPEYDKNVENIMGNMMRYGEEKNIKAEDLIPTDFVTGKSTTNPAVLKQSAEFISAMKKTLKSRFKRVAEDWAPDVQNALNDVLLSQASGAIPGSLPPKLSPDEIEAKNTLADVQKDFKVWLADSSGGAYVRGSENYVAAMDEASKYVAKMKGDNFKDLSDNDDSIEVLARNLKKNQLGSAGEYLSQGAKDKFVNKLDDMIANSASYGINPPDQLELANLRSEIRTADNWKYT